MATELTNLSDVLVKTVERAAESVVAVQARRGVGSSGIIWRDNLILTSSEGVRTDEGIQLLLPDGRVAAAQLRGRDPGTDLTVLEADTKGLKALEFTPDSSLKTGQLVVAVGRTVNTGPIASFGIISGVSGEWKTWRGGKINPFVRLDISTYPTLSGGAAVDANGNLLGLISTGLSRSSVFAVTQGTIDRIAGKLSQQGYVSRGFLGVTLQPVALPTEVKEKLNQETGVMLIGIEPNGPAATGGLLLGDVLVAAEAHGSVQPLTQAEDLADLLERTAAGESIRLRLLRAGELQELDVRVGERPSRRR